MKVDVVIPMYGNWELTEQCLDSLPRDAPVDRVIVVDDGSPDDSAARLMRRTDVVPVILPDNRGFAGACNAGAQRSTADAILFLNNDTIVPQGTIARLAAELESDPEIGAIGPRLLYADGTIQSGGLVLTGPLTTTLLYVHLDGTIPQANRPRNDLLLNGAAILVRRDLFVALGGFDETFHNGVEDCDLCMRIWSHGYRCRYEPAASVIHLEGASRGKTPGDDRNRPIFADRWSWALRDFPHIPWQDPPVIALRWRARDGLDRLARDRILSLLKRFGGARRGLVRHSLEEAALRVLARCDGRDTLRVTYGENSGTNVRIVAPRDPIELAGIDFPDNTSYWVPSAATRASLIERGVPAERIATFRLGAHAEQRSAPRHLDSAILLVATAERARSDEVQRVMRSIEGVPTRIVTYADADRSDLLAVRHAALVVSLDEDPWGLFVTDALAAGSVVVAPRTIGSLEFFPPAAFVGVETKAELAEVVRDVRKDFDKYVERGTRAVREVARRLPEVYAGQRLRELARAAVHGIPEADMVAVTPEFAAALRR